MRGKEKSPKEKEAMKTATSYIDKIVSSSETEGKECYQTALPQKIINIHELSV